MRHSALPASLATALLVLTAGCATGPALEEATPLADFCLEAQRVVVNTEARPALVVHEDFDAFVKSKASIEPFTIHQYVWYQDDDPTRPVMVSCKLKSADHLNAALGEGTAGPDGRCQDLNRLNHRRIAARLGTAGAQPVVFDGEEEVSNAENPGMTGPDWLKPYTMTYRDRARVLHVRTKGFRVDWGDARFQAMPERFRGVQYCHFIAPEYLERLLLGQVQPGILVGREPALTGTGPAMPHTRAP
jgi:hypothetical protein